MKAALLTALMAAQAGDVWTTNRFLASGHGIEVNPVWAALQASLGTYWWLPKMALAVLLATLVARAGSRYIAAALAVSMAIVINNLML